MGTEVKKRRRGRKAIFSEKASTRNITLYQYHYDKIDELGLETSIFVRWLINKKKETFIELGQPECENDKEKAIPTSVSMYREELENISDIDNFSNFVRWGIETSSVTEDYKNQ